MPPPHCPLLLLGVKCNRSGAGDDFFTGGLRFSGLTLGDRASTGGKTCVWDTLWLERGRAPSCFSGAGIGFGSIDAGTWAGGCEIGAGRGAGDDM